MKGRSRRIARAKRAALISGLFLLLTGCAGKKEIEAPVKQYVIRLTVSDTCIQKIWHDGKRWRMIHATGPPCETMEPIEENGDVR